MSSGRTKLKYHNQKVIVNGISFDSRKEARRYGELNFLQKAGDIRKLRRQVKFELLPKQEGERSCSYIADFTYEEKDGNGSWISVVEDCKGMRTDVYRIKRKLMKYMHGITVREV